MAALFGLQQEVSFEGQAAMALEFAADASEEGVSGCRGNLTGMQGELPKVKELVCSILLDWHR